MSFPFIIKYDFNKPIGIIKLLFILIVALSFLVGNSFTSIRGSFVISIIISIALILPYMLMKKLFSCRSIHKIKQIIERYFAAQSPYINLLNEINTFVNPKGINPNICKGYDKERKEIFERIELLNEKAGKIILKEHLPEFSKPLTIVSDRPSYLGGNYEKDSFAHYLAIIENKVSFFDYKIHGLRKRIKDPNYSN